MARERRRKSGTSNVDADEDASDGGAGYGEEGLAPDDQMRLFTTNRVLIGILIALGVHVVVLGATSISFIKTTLLGVSEELPKEKRLGAAKEAVIAETLRICRHYKVDPKEVQDLINPPVAKPTQAATVPTAPTRKPDNAGKDTGVDSPEVEKAKNSEYYKRMNETATPDEIPTTPGDSGGLDSALDTLE